MSVVKVFTVVHNRSAEPVKKIAANFTDLFEKLWDDSRLMQDDILKIDVTTHVVGLEDYADIVNS